MSDTKSLLKYVRDRLNDEPNITFGKPTVIDLVEALESAEANVARLTKMVDWLAERLAERCEELQCVGSGGSDPCYTGKEECETAENFSFTRCWAACSRIKNEKF